MCSNGFLLPGQSTHLHTQLSRACQIEFIRVGGWGKGIENWIQHQPVSRFSSFTGTMRSQGWLCFRLIYTYYQMVWSLWLNHSLMSCLHGFSRVRGRKPKFYVRLRNEAPWMEGQRLGSLTIICFPIMSSGWWWVCTAEKATASPALTEDSPRGPRETTLMLYSLSVLLDHGSIGKTSLL